MPLTRVVAITGCDSGLGWAIAARCAREGLVTVAGMFKGTDTKAADGLRQLCAHPCPLDVSDPKSVTEFRDYVNRLLKDNPDYSKFQILLFVKIITFRVFYINHSIYISNIYIYMGK